MHKKKKLNNSRRRSIQLGWLRAPQDHTTKLCLKKKTKISNTKIQKSGKKL